MSWINSLFNRNRTETIELELLDETDTTIKVKFGIHITFLPKNLITLKKMKKGGKIKVKLPLWLFRKNFN